MTRVTVTLDYLSGSQSKYKTCDLEELDLYDIKMRMMQKNVVGFTITKLLPVRKLLSMEDSLEDQESS